MLIVYPNHDPDTTYEHNWCITFPPPPLSKDHVLEVVRNGRSNVIIDENSNSKVMEDDIETDQKKKKKRLRDDDYDDEEEGEEKKSNPNHSYSYLELSTISTTCSKGLKRKYF